MPRLIRLYIINTLLGFGLAALFVGCLLLLNVGGLWHLVSTVQGGWLALCVLTVLNGIVFGGVQFGIAIMRMQHGSGGGGARTPQRRERLRICSITAR